MKRIFTAVILIILTASWVQGEEDGSGLNRISPEKFQALVTQTEGDPWTSEDGELTIYNVPNCNGEACGGTDSYFLFKCGSQDPAYYGFGHDSGWSQSLGSTTDGPAIRRLKPGAYFTILSLTTSGMHGGETSNIMCFYFREGRELKLVDDITTCWYNDVGFHHNEQLIVEQQDFNRDGRPEVVVKKHRELSRCKGDADCCASSYDGEGLAKGDPCHYEKEDWTRVEGVYDSEGRDLTRKLGQAPCWGEGWPKEFMVTSGDSVSGRETRPDWQNPKAWESLDSNLFARKEFITTKKPERWQGPKDLSFEVKLASTSDQLFLSVRVHDDQVVFDPALRAIYRDHVELWLRSSRGDDKDDVYQLGLLPPKPGEERGEVTLWQSCAGNCPTRAKASIPFPIEQVETKWSRTKDGYQVLIRCSRFDEPTTRPAVCVSDNDSAQAPGQKVMMCDRPPTLDYRSFGPFCHGECG